MKIVLFNAFDKMNYHAFAHNETPLQMHAVLKNICSTYVVFDVYQVNTFNIDITTRETLKNLSTI